MGEKLYKSVKEIPDDIDHAVIIIPARFVPEAVRECGEKGIKVVSILSSGFSEIGNVELEEQVKKIAKNFGIRVIGPNGLGVYDPYTGVDTLFIPKTKMLDGEEVINLARPDKGYIAFLTQSGALGGVLLDYVAGEGLGISKFVSWGNKIDVDESEMMLFLLEDPNTRVIVIYIESMKGDGRRVVDIGSKVSLKKPIVILKGGVTSAGARATLSHTASLAGNIEIYYAAFRRMGAIIAESPMDMLDKAKALAFQPPARGNRVGIVTNGGGPGIILADIAERSGLVVPELSRETLDRLKRYVAEGIIPDIATFSNPIDISGTGTDEAYVAATEAMLDDDRIDIVIILALHHPPTLTVELPKKLINVLQDARKPVLVVDIGLLGLSNLVRSEFDNSSIPSYTLPERAVSGACALVQYGTWLKKKRMLEKYLESWECPRKQY